MAAKEARNLAGEDDAADGAPPAAVRRPTASPEEIEMLQKAQVVRRAVDQMEHDTQHGHPDAAALAAASSARVQRRSSRSPTSAER